MIKNEIHLNSIYQHYKGEYVKVLEVAYHYQGGILHLDDRIVIYQKCDENGIYKSIRDENNEVMQPQPSYRFLNEFLATIVDITGSKSYPRFKFIKEL